MAKRKKKNALSKILTTKAIVPIIVVIVALAVIGVFVIPKMTHKPGEQKVVTVSTLEKVVKTSELSTYETVYNGVSTIMNPDKPDKVDYYVAYEATVKAGLDFNQIQLEKDDENKLIIVSFPPITLQDPVVTIEDLDYIIVNKKMSQDGLSAKAYKECIADVQKEANEQEAIYDYARQNAEKLINGLLTPFIDQMDDNYSVQFEWRES